jgi:hypothetical protein
MYRKNIEKIIRNFNQRKRKEREVTSAGDLIALPVAGSSRIKLLSSSEVDSHR